MLAPRLTLFPDVLLVKENQWVLFPTLQCEYGGRVAECKSQDIAG